MWQENATSPENMKILIVDDIPKNISALALVLESEGFTLEGLLPKSYPLEFEPESI